MSSPKAEKRYWLDDSRNVDKIVYGLYAVCAVLVLLDFVDHKKETHFDFEDWFGFFGFFGFVACVGLVLASKVMRLVVRRDEDYYDR